MQNLDIIKQQILDRILLIDLVSEHVTLKRRGRRWVGLCPFHAEKTPSFTVNPDLGLFKCFGCGKGGDVFSFVQFRENVPFMEAMKILADRANVELGSVGGRSPEGLGRAELARINTWALSFFRANLREQNIGRSARQYLSSQRGVSEELQERFSLGLATENRRGLEDAARGAGFTNVMLVAADLLRKSEEGQEYATFRNRLMFPIRDATGRVVGFGGRTLGDDRAKYLNTRQNGLFDKGKQLYGIDLARSAISERKRAIVVEGYTDCISAHQVGFHETVATLGTALTEFHVDLLRRYCDEVILLFDSDRAGEAAAERAISVALPRCMHVKLARIPDGKDPSEFIHQTGGEGFSDLLRRAVDALEFKWFQTRARFRGDSSDSDRREAVLDFIRVVGQAWAGGAIDAIQRGLLVNQVSHLLGIDRSEVDRLMTASQRKPSTRKHLPSTVVTQRDRHEPGNVEQAGWVLLLEVLLSEPGESKNVGPFPDGSRMVDERDRRIGRIVGGFVESGTKFRLVDVLAQCTDPEDAERVTDLARRGAQKGNRSAQLQMALAKIRGGAVQERLEESKRKLLEAKGQEGVERDQLAMINQGVRDRKAFAGRRFTHRAVASSLPPATHTEHSENTVEQP